MNKVYQIVTDKILEKLDEGTIPWRKPWDMQDPVNWITQKPYRGMNYILLPGGEYLTWNQVQKNKGKVKKGSTAEIVIFWKMWTPPDERQKDSEEEEIKQIPLLRYYKVFHIDDIEGIESKQRDKERKHNPIEEAEEIIQGFLEREDFQVKFKGGRASYSPSEDFVQVPPINDFEDPQAYYSTMFHELAHATKHKDRCNRDDSYAYEELTAEIAAAMLSNIVGIEQTLDNTASYIDHWRNQISKDPKLIVKASAKAQKAVEYILGKERVEEKEKETAVA